MGEIGKMSQDAIETGAMGGETMPNSNPELPLQSGDGRGGERSNGVKQGPGLEACDATADPVASRSRVSLADHRVVCSTFEASHPCLAFELQESCR